MRMHFYRYFTMVFAVIAMMMTIPALAAETALIDDTTLISEELLWDGNIPVDISWKTKQDQGQWIEELDIMDDASSLILVVNRSEQESGKAALMYLSKNTEGIWTEGFSVDGRISGGESLKTEALYGVYNPVQTFGNLSNPGSLLPYRELTGEEHWFLDPCSELYGELQTVSASSGVVSGAINLKEMKVFFNYGMIMKNQNEEQTCKALLFHCLQNDPNDGRFTGIQIPEDALRMLVQCVDEDTCMIVVGSVDDPEALEADPITQ